MSWARRAALVWFEFDLSLFSLFGGAMPLAAGITHSKRERQIKSIKQPAVKPKVKLLDYGRGRKRRQQPTFFIQLILKSWNEKKVWFAEWRAAHPNQFPQFHYFHCVNFDWAASTVIISFISSSIPFMNEAIAESIKERFTFLFLLKAIGERNEWFAAAPKKN